MRSRHIIDQLFEGRAGGPVELVTASAKDVAALGIPAVARHVASGSDIKVCRGLFVDGGPADLVVFPTYIGVFFLGDTTASWRLHEDAAKRPLDVIGAELGLKANISSKELRDLGFDEYI